MTDQDPPEKRTSSPINPLTWTGNGDKTSLSSVRDVITEEFDEQTWLVTEAALAGHATLLLEEAQCFGLVIVGESGAGKTTVLRFFEGLEDQVYRSDDATPAAFVSHDSSRTKEELQEIDLLPRITHQTLLNRDMANWFSGTSEVIKDKMATMANIMDGDGYTRDSGSHGTRGYTDDHRFNFIGATTPLPKRAWTVMGHTGNRFVFHEKHAIADMDDVLDDVFTKSEYSQQISRCSDAIHGFLNDRWEKYDGYAGVEWPSVANEDVQRTIGRLANIVRHARAPINEDDTPSREGPHRILSTLRDLARGRALLEGRKELELGDLQVCARVALSTMPKERRPFVRAVLNPANEPDLRASQLVDLTGRSRMTVHDQMELMDKLGLAECNELDTGRKTKELCRSPDLTWPGTLDFPEL